MSMILQQKYTQWIVKAVNVSDGLNILLETLIVGHRVLSINLFSYVQIFLYMLGNQNITIKYEVH